MWPSKSKATRATLNTNSQALLLVLHFTPWLDEELAECRDAATLLPIIVPQYERTVAVHCFIITCITAVSVQLMFDITVLETTNIYMYNIYCAKILIRLIYSFTCMYSCYENDFKGTYKKLQ